jgi:hypothetical protein
MITKLHTPPGDDRLAWRAIADFPYPFAPPLDPPARGVRILLYDGTGAVIADTTVPPGVYDGNTRQGWVTNPSGSVFTYKQVGNLVPLIGGIRKLVIRDYSARTPGRLRITVTGREGSFPVTTLPARGTIILDPPVTAVGQCADHVFPGDPGPTCTTPSTGVVVCR